MINELTFQYPMWYLGLCLLLGLGYALALYFREQKFTESPSWTRWLMGILRFLTVAGIATFLMSPFIKSISEETKQPIVVIAEDASKSIFANLDQAQISERRSEINKLSEQLGQKFEVKRLTIGDEIKNGPVDSFDFKVTNLSKSLEFIYDNYGDQNLGAIIMSTDGIYNEGKNPLYANVNLASPLYVIAQGDTTIRKDLLIKNAFNNKIAYLGDKFSVQVDIAAKNCSSSASSLTISRVDGEKTTKLKTENIRVNKEDFFMTKEVILNADKVGLLKYRIALSPVNGEVSNTNNYKDIFIEVLDARQKILLYANGPHPDLTALKSLITTNKNYEVEIKYPREEDVNISKYDFVVFHNLPSAKYPIPAELSKINAKKTPRLFIVGAQSDLSEVNKAQENIAISGNSSSLEDILADVVPGFNSFILDPEMSKKLKSFPPLVAPFGQYTIPAGASTLLKQNIKKIPTDYPLLSFMEKGGVKTGVWVGEGIWKWRLFDFLQNENYKTITELVNKSIQFLSTKDDKRKFRVSSAKNLYKENEQIAFDAQLYNDNYEMITDPDVFMTVINQDGKEYKYTFNRSSNYYTLNAGMLPAGKYSYKANVNFNGEEMDQKGNFSIQNIQMELYDLTARHGLLRALTSKYGGQLVLGGQAGNLSDVILKNDKIKPVIYQSSDTKSIINFKWLFGLILAFLCVEWFLRRYFGSY